jgi:hypothetical protein
MSVGKLLVHTDIICYISIIYMILGRVIPTYLRYVSNPENERQSLLRSSRRVIFLSLAHHRSRSSRVPARRATTQLQGVGWCEVSCLELECISSTFCWTMACRVAISKVCYVMLYWWWCWWCCSERMLYVLEGTERTRHLETMTATVTGTSSSSSLASGWHRAAAAEDV